MKKVIFDVDGVLLSEKRYFDVSALTLWEWYNGCEFMDLGGEAVDPNPADDRIDALRARYWADDAILAWLKSRGVNSNWDMVHAHIVAALWIMLSRRRELLPVRLDGMPDVRALGRALAGTPVPGAGQILDRLDAAVPPSSSGAEVFAALGAAVASDIGPQAWTSTSSRLWCLHFEAFQEWYFGDALYEQTYGKKPCAPGKEGFLRREQPLGAPERLREMFAKLRARGWQLGVATGRSAPEVRIPFDMFGWTEQFDPLFVATYTDVEQAQDMLGIPLDKPHPFVYCVGAFGRRPQRYTEYVADPRKFKQGEYVFVGDSVADVRAARRFGARVIATLTGLDGRTARPQLEREGADEIVDTVEDILAILK